MSNGNFICESGGTGRRARLRGVWLHRTGSSPVSRTKKSRSLDLLFHFVWKTTIFDNAVIAILFTFMEFGVH